MRHATWYVNWFNKNFEFIKKIFENSKFQKNTRISLQNIQITFLDTLHTSPMGNIDLRD